VIELKAFASSLFIKLSYFTHSESHVMPRKSSAQALSKTASVSIIKQSVTGSSSPSNNAETTAPKIEWIKHHGISHAFPAVTPDEIIGSGKRTKLELTIQGSVTKRFLGKTNYRHNVNLKVEEKEITNIKNIFKSSPDFREIGFKYPVIEGNILRIVAPKDVIPNDDGEFDAAWDARGVWKIGQALPDVDKREPISATSIEEDAKVVIECAVGTWKWEGGQNLGGRLDLLSIGLVEDANIGVEFTSPKKKRKMLTS
jgi:hypothetical protein